jgi:AraC family transcriptional regulator, arabinose operon regulatory protein
MPVIANPSQFEDTPAPEPGILVSAFFSQPYGYAVRREYGTRDWLATFTYGGRGQYRYGGSAYTCQPNDLVLLAPNTLHDYATTSQDAPWQFYWVHFIPRPNWIVWLSLPEAHPGVRVYTIQEHETTLKVVNAFHRMVTYSAAKGPYQDELAQNALEEALLLIARERSFQFPSSHDPRVDTVQKYLEQHYNQAISLPLLANLVSLSPWRLSHLYKEVTGQTVMEHLTRLRLRQAARLLEFTSRQVEEIAGDVGFESPFHFSRMFKRYYGVSPTQFRSSGQSRQAQNE